MTSHSKLYFSDDFSPEKAKDYTLLIQIRNTDFSFAVVYQSALLAWGNGYPLSELINPTDFIHFLTPTDYQKVVIGIVPAVFNIVPKAIYQEKHLAQLVKLLDVNETDKVYSQTLDTENQVVFKDNNEILPALTARYPNHQIVFGYKGWLEAIAKTGPAIDNLYVDIQASEVHFAYFKESKLRFYNSFKYTDPNDLAYFTALTTNELQLNPEDTYLVISGDADVSRGNLNEFFPNIDTNPIGQLQALPNGITAQQLLSLTALILCA
ncbi:DUF3822 family protein [Mucilaginibacter jinjuensis]|uniref:DUF3822 family protein n=1 Tax=Mucilaginibacter jinjuensis TaxID=1176721 RepID=A0ABY7TF47_9SPHI|nr:DUF3822 family protein [Mucilaginibacter jinjuensis]WCT14724.1 DUF3822 family protein [Mucilaginibacter jinjuensis]